MEKWLERLLEEEATKIRLKVADYLKTDGFFVGAKSTEDALVDEFITEKWFLVLHLEDTFTFLTELLVQTLQVSARESRKFCDHAKIKIPPLEDHELNERNFIIDDIDFRDRINEILASNQMPSEVDQAIEEINILRSLILDLVDRIDDEQYDTVSFPYWVVQAKLGERIGYLTAFCAGLVNALPAHIIEKKRKYGIQKTGTEKKHEKQKEVETAIKMVFSEKTLTKRKRWTKDAIISEIAPSVKEIMSRSKVRDIVNQVFSTRQAHEELIQFLRKRSQQ